MIHPLRLFASALTLVAFGLLPALAEEPQMFTLDNGMEVVVIEDHRAPVVVHMVWYRVGAADDPAGQSGIAHYLEHLMFKATETMEEGEFSQVVEANGGRDNAFTSWDYTAYHQRVAADRLGLMMQMEADRMVNLRLDRSSWRPERDVILRERGQTLESNPHRQFSEQLRAALFQNHPYGRPIIGWRHEMEELTGEIATEFYRRFYAPNNAILIVAGDVEAEEALALANEHYGPIPAAVETPERIRATEPPHLAERRVIMHDERVSNPYVSRQYLAPIRRSGDQSEAAAYQVLAVLLGGSSQTSVLERSLTYDQEIALTAWAGYNGDGLDNGTFSLGVMPVPGVSLQDAEDALDAVLADFIENGVDDAQFERVQMQIRAEAIYQQDDARRRANAIGSDLAVGLTLADSLDWINVLQAVTPEDVINAARSLDRRSSVTGWLMGEDA
ncbi:M16 family metallopeptidase [Pararhodobacter oceanensis]|uniref:Peptidase M16 n=1 Tax=Pararhodobacter oceanensis TaxID=2172121 RepID=A0A2T8HRA2_9RHOB|nr:pitrilysin family protein [Pararhodobacter oceanensis]PVH27913.1 peptidase M16 [Pararhodobacter oceanensis]